MLMCCFGRLWSVWFWKKAANFCWVLRSMAGIKLLRLRCLSCPRVSTRPFIRMTIGSNISLSLLHQSIRIVKHGCVRWRYGAWVIMWLHYTFLESVLNRKFIVSCCSRSFAELLFDCLLDATLLGVGLNHHHFAGILLDRVLLHIWAHSNLLRRSYLHASLGSIAQYVLVANRMCICLQQRIGDALSKRVQLITHYHTWSELVFQQTVVHRVISEISRQLIAISRQWVFHCAA